MSEKKPVPLIPNRDTKICPVCKHPSYSPSGVHPQCVVDQSDSVRLETRRDKQRKEKEKLERRKAK